MYDIIYYVIYQTTHVYMYIYNIYIYIYIYIYSRGSRQSAYALINRVFPNGCRPRQKHPRRILQLSHMRVAFQMSADLQVALGQLFFRQASCILQLVYASGPKSI